MTLKSESGIEEKAEKLNYPVNVSKKKHMNGIYFGETMKIHNFQVANIGEKSHSEGREYLH